MYKLEFIKDVTGNSYLGIYIDYDKISWFINQLKGILGDEYEEYEKYKKNRDGNKYHITVIPVFEFNKILKSFSMKDFSKSIEKIDEYEFDDIRFKGIGKAEKNGNIAYYIVVESEKLDLLRDIYGLEEKDFHITLGFKWKDVFGIRKNIVMEIEDPFLVQLSSGYYSNYESFGFVKELQNFEGDMSQEVEPIKIGDTSATFRIGEFKYYTVSYIGDKLIISAKWEDNKEIPIMSWTSVVRKLKKK